MPDHLANPPSERTETSFTLLDQPLVGLPNPENTEAQEHVSFVSIFKIKNKSFVGRDIQKRIMKLTGNTSRIESDRLCLQTPGKRKYHEVANNENDLKKKVGSPDYTENQPN